MGSSHSLAFRILDVFQVWFGFSWRHSCSHSHTPSLCADKDRREEQSSLDFVAVVAHLYSVNELLEAPENRKIHCFQAALDDEDQPVSSHRLPVGGALADILADIDDCVSSPFTGMHLKKVLKLLLCPSLHNQRFNVLRERRWLRHAPSTTM